MLWGTVSWYCVCVCVNVYVCVCVPASFSSTHLLGTSIFLYFNLQQINSFCLWSYLYMYACKYLYTPLYVVSPLVTLSAQNFPTQTTQPIEMRCWRLASCCWPTPKVDDANTILTDLLNNNNYNNNLLNHLLA